HKLGSATAVLTAGANFHDNQINVGLYPRQGRAPTGVSTRADAHVTNGAGYAQETVSFFNGRLLLGAGLRFDEFRFDIVDKVNPDRSGAQPAGRWQGKGSAAFTPSRSIPLTFHANYGRGINSIDARGDAVDAAARYHRFLPVRNFFQVRAFFPQYGRVPD